MKKIAYLGIAIGTLGLLAGCQSNENQNQAQNQSNTQTSQTQTMKDSSASSSTTGKSVEGDLRISVEEAIKAYQDTYPDSDITSLELDTSFGAYYYKIEGVNDTTEFEIKVDGVTKKVEKEREEQLDSDEQNGVKRKEDKIDIQNLLSIEKAAEIAVQQVGGGTATDWDLDKDLGITFWEVTVENNQQETTVKMNAQTGEILETEVDD
ncbi:PepSY domain-containing protein [Candidatus Enterococcus courvalinii]|uniref:PepSY domain-containing protein n=1 Tax=Candidatus Enterococcus courvalinii TaxID=2815329 RepID=A0ABS3HXB1_9ENTE|nr:PepSY domain-containing protein [Enterococcus sp. MSG2901]MBO0481112.1 PepSY domain-containing protein [Enterococcus sp. MSG2901]